MKRCGQRANREAAVTGGSVDVLRKTLMSRSAGQSGSAYMGMLSAAWNPFAGVATTRPAGDMIRRRRRGLSCREPSCPTTNR